MKCPTCGAEIPAEPARNAPERAVANPSKMLLIVSVIAIGIAATIVIAEVLSFSYSPQASVQDADGDGVVDGEDAFPTDPSEWMDADGDGFGNNGDAFPTNPDEWRDLDGDGFGNNEDDFPADPSEWHDADGDGFGNNEDSFPTDPSEWLDSDGDGFGNNEDAFPTDPDEWLDSDGDGFGNNEDAFPVDPNEWMDSDGDGYGDNEDAYPYDPTKWSVTTPVSSITKTTISYGVKYTFAPMSKDTPWGDVTIQLTDGTNTLTWSPTTAGLTDSTPPAEYDDPTTAGRALGSLTVWCNLTDLAGNGYVNQGDYMTFQTGSTTFSASTTYTVTIMHDPTSAEICHAIFTG